MAAILWKVSDDHAFRQGCREGPRVPRLTAGGRVAGRPARGRARRRLLGLSVPARLRRAARGRRRIREPRAEAVDRRGEPALRARLDDRLRGNPAGRRLQGQQPQRGSRVRLWLLLPRRRGGAGLGRLTRRTVAIATVCALAVAVGGCGSAHERAPAPRTGAALAPSTAPAFGLTEANAALLWSPAIGDPRAT